MTEDYLVVTIIGGVISTVLGATGLFIKSQISKVSKHWIQVADLKKAVWRLNKTVVIMATILDGMAKKTHPEIQTELEDIARELLTSYNSDYEEESD